MAGAFLQQYEVYYKRLDVDGKGEIGAMEAAGFLKKSGLPDDLLGKVRPSLQCNTLKTYLMIVHAGMRSRDLLV